MVDTRSFAASKTVSSFTIRAQFEVQIANSTPLRNLLLAIPSTKRGASFVRTLREAFVLECFVLVNQKQTLPLVHFIRHSRKTNRPPKQKLHESAFLHFTHLWQGFSSPSVLPSWLCKINCIGSVFFTSQQLTPAGLDGAPSPPRNAIVSNCEALATRLSSTGVD